MMIRGWRLVVAGVVTLIGLGGVAWLGAADPPELAWPHPTFHPVSLIERFDNDGIASPPEVSDGNYDCPDHPEGVPGSSYPGELLPETGSIYLAPGTPAVPFLFPAKQPGENNNVSCHGQSLRFTEGNFAAVYFLGSCENGDSRGTLGIGYSESGAEAELAFTDWCRPAAFGERVAFTFPHRNGWVKGQPDKEPITCYLWVQRVNLDPNRILRRLSLPYQRRMHLFAVTLVKAPQQRTEPPKPQELADEAQETARLYLTLRQREAVTAGVVRAELRQGLAEITASPALAAWPRECHWLLTSLQYQDNALPKDALRIGGRQISAGRQALSAARADLVELVAGRNPFPPRRGQLLRSFQSPVDGAWQPYALSVPQAYRGDRPFPLMVELHGHGGYGSFQGYPAPLVNDALVLSPHGRGSIDYMLAAETDVRAAIAEVCRDYRIDPDRIILEGHSMGGTGSWQLGTRFPDLFSCLAPVAGNTTHDIFFRDRPIVWQPAESFRALHDYVQAVNDPLTYAMNVAPLPIFCMHGARDLVVRVEHARRMIAQIQQFGGKPIYREFPGVEHAGFPGNAYDERWHWMLAQQRQPRPAHFQYRTTRLRYPGAWWLRIRQFWQFGRLAEIGGEQADAHRVNVTTDNVADFCLLTDRLPQAPVAPLAVWIDGQERWQGEPAAELRFRWDATGPGVWRRVVEPTPAAPPTLAKRAGSEGPIEDAFLTPFVLVYGTTGGAFWQRLLQGEAEALAVDWDLLYHVRPPIKADTEVTADDLRERHLICYGGPAQNQLAARLCPGLPLQLDATGLTFGGRRFTGAGVGIRLCYPNPLNPDRYVVLAAAPEPRGLWQGYNRTGNFTGWGPLDNWNWFDYAIYDDSSTSPDTLLAVGFFGPDWRVDPRSQWFGDAERRAAMTPRRWPPYLELPAPGAEPATLWLSELLPTSVRQHLGAANLDRSYGHGPLRVGNTVHEKGLGVRPRSALEFALDGRYAKFRSAFGFDLEGAAKLPDEQAKSVRLQFLVFGDGKHLWSSEWLAWNQYPPPIEVPIVGVKTLRLEVQGGGPMWLWGSAAWGSAQLTR